MELLCVGLGWEGVTLNCSFSQNVEVFLREFREKFVDFFSFQLMLCNAIKMYVK